MGDILVISALVLILALAARSLWKGRGKGGCSGNCSGCTRCHHE